MTARRYRQHRYHQAESACELLLIRHGESAVADPDRPFATRDGHGDPPLHPVGRDQAVALAGRLAEEYGSVDAIYVSSLVRTQQTAAPVAEAFSVQPRVDRDLREVFLGILEGGEYRRAEAEGDDHLARAYAENTRDVIPGAEREASFTGRVRRTLDKLAAEHAGQRIVVVTHGAVIDKALTLGCGSRPLTMFPDNASISKLFIDGSRWAVRTFNDTAHLAVSSRAR